MYTKRNVALKNFGVRCYCKARKTDLSFLSVWISSPDASFIWLGGYIPTDSVLAPLEFTKRTPLGFSVSEFLKTCLIHHHPLYIRNQESNWTVGNSWLILVEDQYNCGHIDYNKLNKQECVVKRKGAKLSPMWNSKRQSTARDILPTSSSFPQRPFCHIWGIFLYLTLHFKWRHASAPHEVRRFRYLSSQ
jgi:hypothetical protein